MKPVAERRPERVIETAMFEIGCSKIGQRHGVIADALAGGVAGERLYCAKQAQQEGAKD